MIYHDDFVIIVFHYNLNICQGDKMNKINNANELKTSVILIDNNGTNLGQVTPEMAIRKADETGLDLVLLDNSKNICKLMNLSKELYKKSKNVKFTKKTKLKEIRFTTNIAKHDIQTKVKHIEEFLTDGDKVKISIKSNNRVTLSGDKSEEKLNEILSSINVAYIKDSFDKNGNFLSVYISPDKQKKRA
jgi:translation initiation factor IF-3